MPHKNDFPALLLHKSFYLTKRLFPPIMSRQLGSKMFSWLFTTLFVLALPIGLLHPATYAVFIHPAVRTAMSLDHGPHLENPVHDTGKAASKSTRGNTSSLPPRVALKTLTPRRCNQSRQYVNAASCWSSFGIIHFSPGSR